MTIEDRVKKWEPTRESHERPDRLWRAMLQMPYEAEREYKGAATWLFPISEMRMYPERRRHYRSRARKM